MNLEWKNFLLIFFKNYLLNNIKPISKNPKNNFHQTNNHNWPKKPQKTTFQPHQNPLPNFPSPPQNQKIPKNNIILPNPPQNAKLPLLNLLPFITPLPSPSPLPFLFFPLPLDHPFNGPCPCSPLPPSKKSDWLFFEFLLEFQSLGKICLLQFCEAKSND